MHSTLVTVMEITITKKKTVMTNQNMIDFSY